MSSVQNLTVDQVKQKLDQGEALRLIDVREPHEHAVAKIDGAELLPMSRAREWVATVPRDQEVVLFCHHGARSAQVANFMAAQLGYTNLANMVGGIDEWSTRIDPKVPRY